MSILQQWATGTNKQTTLGEYDNEIPNTEPTGAAYVNWKAQNYSTTARIKKGSTGSTDTVNKWYNLAKMAKLRKILKRESKFGQTAMAA